jgi:hypothetical protein
MHGVGHVPTFADAFPDAVLDFLLEQERSFLVGSLTR